MSDDRRITSNSSTNRFQSENESNNETNLSGDELKMTTTNGKQNKLNLSPKSPLKETNTRTPVFGHRQSSSFDTSLIDTSGANEVFNFIFKKMKNFKSLN